MITSIYYSLAIAAYSIFLIQFFVAMFGGSDMDGDIDFDGDGTMDLTWGDIFSFKGLIHFLMGFAGWLSLTAAKGSPILWYDYIIALAIGIGFVLMLVFLGKLLMKLRQEPTGTSGWDYVGHDGFITVVCSDEPDVYYVMLKDLGSTELKVYSRSKTKYKLASEVTIVSYEDGKYFIN